MNPSPAAHPAPPTSPDPVPRWAAACTASGAAGLAATALVLLPPADVPDDTWSYPLSFGPALALGLVLAVVHLGTALGFLAWDRLTAGGSGAASRALLRTTAAALVALSAAEVASGLIGRARLDSTTADVVGAAFGLVSLVLVVTSVGAGVALLRRRLGPPTAAWASLASGVVLLVLVTPGNIAGDVVLRTGGLALWSACFVVLGLALARHDRRDGRGAQNARA